MKSSLVQKSFLPEIIDVLKLKRNVFNVTVGPFSSNFGHIVGNAIRRILLSSIPGSAVTEVKIENAPHEYCAIDGVREDIVEILLNLKKLSIILDDQINSACVELKKSGPSTVTAGDLTKKSGVLVVNPEEIIANISRNVHLNMSLKISKGRGYSPFVVRKKNVEEESFKELGYVPIDASFSPIINVSFKVSDYFLQSSNKEKKEKIEVMISTNGTIEAVDAVRLAITYFYEQVSVFSNLTQSSPDVESEEEVLSVNPIFLKPLEELDLTVRSANCLKAHNIKYLGDLVHCSEFELMRIPNLGRKSLNEIKSMLSSYDLILGTKLENWPPKKIVNNT